MKLPIHDLQNKKTGEQDLPKQFSEAYRPDLIRRAVLSLQSKARQRYGADPKAGQRHSSELSKRRRKYRGCYGFGISRVNRKIHSRRGTRMFWVGATSPQTRGGRRSHPPKAEKDFTQAINKKENRKAIRSAISAVLNKEIVSQRGHNLPELYPFIIDSSLEQLKTTKQAEKTLDTLGFGPEMERTLLKKVRAGIGKLRGRKYRRKKGLLIVVGEDCPIQNAASNIPGVTITPVASLNAEILAPGALPGRVTLWTQNAINKLNEKKLFI
tara:strand:+ start:15935 stop:16741 length:807 start_codon:yes stop_codon:yes gene_type:complete